jgi:hypothetical protein
MGIFEPNRDALPREWRKLHIGDFNDLYCSPKITELIKSKRMRWAEHVERMIDRRVKYRV